MVNTSLYQNLLSEYNWTGFGRTGFTKKLPTTGLNPDGNGVYTIKYNFLMNQNDVDSMMYYDTPSFDANQDGSMIFDDPYTYFVAADQVQKNASSIIIHQDTNYDYGFSTFYSDVTKINYQNALSSQADITIAQNNENSGLFSNREDQNGNPVPPSDVIGVTIGSPALGEKFYGDIWLNEGASIGWGNANEGEIQFMAIMHEIGHAMGLGHPPVDTFFDSQKYTIMSEKTNADVVGIIGENVYPSGLQVLDILAMQEIFKSRNYTTRSDNTIYSKSGAFASNATNDAFTYTIWDGGGSDDVISAFDYSNYGAQIDLRQGHFSSIGGKTNFLSVDWDTQVNGATTYTTYDAGNVSIAYYTIIENAAGTANADSLIGNAWNNTLRGFAGDDELYGDGIVYDGDKGEQKWDKASGSQKADGNNSGDDFLDGGAGNDLLNGGKGSDTAIYTNDLVINGVGITAVLNADGTGTVLDGFGDTDTLIGIENVIGSSGNDTFTINGSASNRVINGGDGTDVVNVQADIFDDANDIVFTTTGHTVFDLGGSGNFTHIEEINANGAELILGDASVNKTYGFQNINYSAVPSSPTGAIINYQQELNATQSGTFSGSGSLSSSATVSFADQASTHQIQGLDASFSKSPIGQFSGFGGMSTITGTNNGDVIHLNSTSNVSIFTADFTFLINAMRDETHVEIVTGRGNDTVDGILQSSVNIVYNGGDDRYEIFSHRTSIAIDEEISIENTSISNLLVNDNGAVDAFDLVTDKGTLTITLPEEAFGEFSGLQGLEINFLRGGSITVTNPSVIKTGESNDGVTITGDWGDDVLVADGTGQTILGLGGNDTITGAAGNDILDGGAGNDTYIFAAGGGRDTIRDTDGVNNVLDVVGGLDPENFVYSRVGDDLQVDIASGVLIEDYFTEADTIRHIETDLGSFALNSLVNGALGILNGSSGSDTLNSGSISSSIFAFAGDDTIFGEDGDDIIDGGEGNDSIDGGAGQDTVTYASSGAGVTVDLGAGTATGYGNDTITNVEHVFGSDFDDVLIGDANNNALEGGLGDNDLQGMGGNDTLFGGAGSDLLDGGAGNDIINGFLGEDTVTYASASAGVTVDLSTGTAMGDGTDTITNVENITGSTHNDILTGDANDNVLDGGLGDDVILGGLGNDTITDIQGNNFIDGGLGLDTMSYAAASSGVNVDLQINSANGSTISNIENIIGSNLDDTITGDGRDNVIEGGAGNDVIDGGAGLDTASYASASAGVTVSLGSAGSLGIATGDGNDSLSSIENVIGSDFDDTLTGGAENNVLSGGLGNDSYNVNLFDGSQNVIIDGSGTNTMFLQGFANVTDNDIQVIKIGDDVLLRHALTGGSVRLVDALNIPTIDSITYEQGASIITLTAATLDAILAANGAENMDPVAVDDDFNAVEDVAFSGNVLGNDTDFEGAQFLSVVPQTVISTLGASVVLNTDGSFTYTPAADVNGQDSFTYQLTDGIGGSDIGTAFVNITAVSDSPDAVDDGFGALEDIVLNGNVLSNDSDPDGDAITANAATITTVAGATVVLNADGTFAYTPVADFNGEDSFTYTITDATGVTDTATAFVSVVAINDNPVAVDDSFSTDEGVVLNGNVVSNDTDIDGDSLNVVAETVTSTSGASVVLNADGTFTYTPATSFVGADSFTYTTTDNNGGTDTGTVNVTVLPSNTAPVAVDDSFAMDEDGILNASVLINDTDVDLDVLTVTPATLTTTSGADVVLNADGTFTYTPVANFNGADSFDYTLDDGNGGTDIGTVNITVNAVNDNPVANDDAVTTDEDIALSGNVLGNDTDVDGDTLTVTAETVTSTAGANVVLGTDGSFDYTPVANFNGADSFDYTVTDGNGGSDVGTVNVTVNPVNDAPTPQDDEFIMDYGTQLTGNVLVDNGFGADSDPEGDTVNVVAGTLITQQGQSVAIDTAGNFTYVGPTNFFGFDSFTYMVSDGNGGFETAVATIEITIPAGATQGGGINETITGGDGADVIFGFAGADYLDGKKGNDVLYGGTGGGSDILYGDKGNDVLLGEGDDDFLYGGHDDDVIYGDGFGFEGYVNGDDSIYAGNGNDEVHAGDGDDYVNGNAGNDTIYGEGGDDLIQGGVGDDFISGGQGHDTIDGGVGKDTIEGNAGNDVIDGQSGDDTLSGGNGNDVIEGGNGADIIDGGAGNDSIDGGSGDDLITGGFGADTMFGGAGADIFDLNDTGSIDVIGDFKASQGDAIDIADIITGYDALNDNLADWAEITDNGTDSFLSVDLDGTGTAFAMTQIVTIEGVTGLTDEDALVASNNLLVA